MRILIAALVILALSGCSVVGPATGHMVSEYCSTPLPDRMLVRTIVDQEASPHKVRIYCNQDFVELPENSLIE